MKHAEFIHFVRLSEYACAEQPKQYRRSVALFAALGYAWVAACLLVALGLLWWVVPYMLQGHVRHTTIGVLIGAIGLGWSSLRALLVRIDSQPEGIKLTQEQAPELFKALDRIQRKVKGPKLDEVYVDHAFNASITQLPKYGLLGGTTNRLHLGLPLVMALDVPRLLAVLAHEYGHLRGGHGRFAAWIYRTRLSWARLNDSLSDEGIANAVTQYFLKWYVPRFVAKTFALARQDEYEADRIAAKLYGTDAMAAALVEIDVKGSWLQADFWPSHWQNASRHPTPVGPFKAMRHLLISAPDTSFAQETLRQALKRLSQIDDTHPVLKDRIEALKQRPALPTWSSHGAVILLGQQLDSLIAHFDKQWCREHASDWKAHHSRMTRLAEQVQDWQARSDSLNTDELVQWAYAQRRLDRRVNVSALFEQALQRNGSHPAALQGLIWSLDPAERPRKLSLLEQLWQASEDHHHWAASKAIAELEAQQALDGQTPAALKLWRQRAKDTQAQEGQAWDELTTPPWFSNVARHDLNETELASIRESLVAHPSIAKAWLVRKRLQSWPQRRAYLVLVELPKLSDPQRYNLCRQLEQQLDLPGPALVLWAGTDPTLQDIQRSAYEPIHTR